MRYLKTILAAAALVTASGTGVFAQQMSPLTKAMFKAYEETLREDPNDYITLYRRAVEYYRQSMYRQAFDDVTAALKLTPAKEADLLNHEYSLLADIYLQLNDYTNALEAVNMAIKTLPSSYADIYKKGNIYLDLKEYDNAFKTFESMLRLKSRSQEALFGMASACALKGDKDQATKLAEEMKSVDSTSPLTFCRLGQLYSDMGEDEKAVVNYLTAISLADDIQRPIDGLEKIALNNYDAYHRGFEYAVSQVPDKSDAFQYIRAAIDANTGHLEDAYSIFSQLASGSSDLSPSFLTRMAEVCLSLNKIQEASSYADRALSIEPVAEAYMVKSACELANNAPANAILFATKAYDPAHPDVESLMAKAKAQVAQGDGASALVSLNEALLIDAESLPALLLRAYVKQYLMTDVNAAKSDLERAATIEATEPLDIAYRAIAQTLSGKVMDGEATMNTFLAQEETPEILAAAAIYYAQTGDSGKSRDFADRAEQAGLEDLYLFKVDKTPYLTLSTKR